MPETTLPDEAYYSITRLQKTERLTREKQPDLPRFDASRPMQEWRLTDEEAAAVDGNEYKYKTWNAGARSFVDLSITAKDNEALFTALTTPNVPGEPPYEKWVVQPTPAHMVGPNGPSSSISPNTLCTLEQAEMLASEIPGAIAVETPWASPMFRLEWAGETRRHYAIKVGSSSPNAGLLLAQRWAKGVGYPGRWEFMGVLGSPQFIPDPPPSITGAGEYPIPYRLPVKGKEEIYEGGFGAAIVYRLDRESIYNPAGSSTGGTDTIALARLEERMERIETLLVNLSMALGIGG